MSQQSPAVGDDLSTHSEEVSLLARVEDLHLHFETKRGTVKALDGVNFDIYDGEILALVGETGCGKTITGRSFMQLVPTPPGFYPDGRVLMRSREGCADCGGSGCESCFSTGQQFDNLLALSRKEITEVRGKRIAMIFQDPGTALNPSLTILNQVAEAILTHRSDEVLESAGVDLDELNPLTREFIKNELAIRRSGWMSLIASIPPLRRHKEAIREEIRERVVQVLSDVQIPSPREVLSDYPHEMSGGQKQRVVIAIGLVANPDLLIADEATTALDVTTQKRILHLIGDLQDEYGTSLLYITHDLNLVREIADRVAVMYAGQIAEIGSVDQVYNDPHHPYTKGLINSIPRPEKRGERLEGIGGSIPDLTNPPEGCRFCTRCPEVMDHCWDVEPELVEVGDDQKVHCHLYTSDETEQPADGQLRS